MKLGIACVYFFREEDEWIMDLQLDFIKKSSSDIDFTVYAAANRLQPQLKKRLASHSFVKIIDLPSFEGHGGQEHSHFLSLLIECAKEDGCSHICTLDCDSFPVRQGWASDIAKKMSPNFRVASVFRAENDDTDLPHPCGTFMEATVLDDVSVEFWPNETLRMSPDFKRYIAETNQRIDTGVGLGYALWKAGIPWLRLMRSNSLDMHFMMAGIYDDVFFHLGASSRAPTFNKDYQSRLSLRFFVATKTIPVFWRLGRRIENDYIAKNRVLAKEIQNQLQNDADGFINRLRKG